MKTQTQGEISRLQGRKGGLETQKRKLEEKLEELKARKERLERRIAALMADPGHNPEEVAKLRERLAETSTEISLTEAAIRTAEDRIAAVARELEAARKRAEEEKKVEAELQYLGLAQRIEGVIPELARLGADAMEALHRANPKTSAPWAGSEGFANLLLKSLGFALYRELRDRGQTGLAALVQIQCATFAGRPPKPLSESFVSEMALVRLRRQGQKQAGDRDEVSTGQPA